MKLEKAIERLQYWLDTPYRETKVDFRDALKLGIEALKQHQFQRTHYRHLNLEPLPGETEI